MTNTGTSATAGQVICKVSAGSVGGKADKNCHPAKSGAGCEGCLRGLERLRQIGIRQVLESWTVLFESKDEAWEPLGEEDIMNMTWLLTFDKIKQIDKFGIKKTP